MSRTSLAGMMILALALSSCNARTTPPAPGNDQQSSQRLTTATLTFRSLDDGKDAKSAVTAQLLRNANELGAETTASGTGFDDNATAAPIVMSLRGPFNRDDTRTGQLRLRLTPDGNDTWTFNVGLTLRYADDSQQNFAWQSIRLDEKAPERTLVLAGAEGQ